MNEKICENAFKGEDLKVMQSWSLERKVQVTQTRLIEWYKRYDGNVYISFSGGKDSTVLLDLARRIFPDIKAAFCDTGLEYPEVRDFVKTFKNVEFLKPKMNFKDVLEKYGYPVISKEQSQFIQQYRNAKSEKTKDTRINGNRWGMGKISKKWLFMLDAPFKISEQCCNIMKKNPAKKFEKETGLHPIIGVMAEEGSKRVQDYLKFGCNAFEAKRPMSRPMGFWTEQDVLHYLRDFNIPYAECYGEIEETDGKLHTTKCDRTGCVFCLYGIQYENEPNRIQRLEKTHPQLWKYCIDNLKIGMVLDYMKIPYKSE